MCHMETTLLTSMAVRDACVTMEKPHSVSQMSVDLFNVFLVAAPTGDRATVTVKAFRY